MRDVRVLSSEPYGAELVLVRFVLDDGRRGHVLVRSGHYNDETVPALLEAGAVVLTARDGAYRRVGTAGDEPAEQER